MTGRLTRTIEGAVVTAAGAAMVAGAATRTENRILTGALGLLVVTAGVAVLRDSLLVTTVLWAGGWVALAGGIATRDVAAVVGGAAAVAGGAFAYATQNYLTWFGVAALGDAVALAAVALRAFGTHGALAGAGAATAAVAALAMGAVMLASMAGS